MEAFEREYREYKEKMQAEKDEIRKNRKEDERARVAYKERDMGKRNVEMKQKEEKRPSWRLFREINRKISGFRMYGDQLTLKRLAID